MPFFFSGTIILLDYFYFWRLFNQINTNTLKMKKTLTSIVLALFFFTSFAQNPSEEIDPIQEFISATTQVPFMAKVANTKGIVSVAVTIGENNLPDKYEIVQNLTDECDKEALRVVKLIHPKYLKDKLAENKRIVLEVPFLNSFNVFYSKGYQMDYFDKYQKRHFGSEAMYARRYLVDTLSGRLIGNVEYFVIKDKMPSLIEISKLQIDSSQQNSSELIDKTDANKIYTLTAFSKFKFPTLSQSYYKNGRAVYRNFNDENYEYYPNGRISSFHKIVKEDKFIKNYTIKWHPNGLMASIITHIPNTNQENDEVADKYLAVWDSLGNQIVKNGEGFCEYCKSRNDDSLAESGLITSGVKDGIWKIRDTKGEMVYEEFFDKGVFIKGTFFEKEKRTVYRMQDEQAYFEGGMQAFLKHLQRNLKFPAEAQRANAGGKVYVQFTVLTDGSLSDVNVIKSVGFGCDEEASRVIELTSGRWNPRKQRGKAVKSKMTMPISFVTSQ